ncbi:MAG: GGDEF domain-containing protein [Oscillospiraceae bacterium]|nr:GGDEF domain-containing protein [Oscillospiraceae bacterium]
MTRDAAFNEQFQQLVSEMTVTTRPPDVAEIERLISSLCAMFRLSRAVTRAYSEPKEEKMGLGETLSCYDTGVPSKEVRHMRVVTSVMSIVTLTLYMPEEEEPLDEYESEKVDLVMRTVLSFVSRNRLRDIVAMLAYTDEMGFPNFRSFAGALMKMNARDELGGKAAIYYNLRHYTIVNQQAGRTAGDEIMHIHYETVHGLMGEGCAHCRLGGDNFIAIFDKERLEAVLSYLRKAKVLYTCGGGGSMTVRSCVGAYIAPEGLKITDSGEIMNKIVASYREAKNDEKPVVYYSEDIERRKENSDRISELFPDALENREFRVWYQPKVNITTGELCGAEALCRWYHDGDIIPPMHFIPVIEQTNDICRLDMHMLEMVCADLSRWIMSGKRPVRVSVNMSRRHMSDEKFVQKVSAIIDRYGLLHDFIELELTETAMNVGLSSLKQIVGDLRSAGIRVSIDDFGVGYSSLNLIKDIPWNVLKIDRSFLPLDKDSIKESDSIMLRHVIGMSKEMGLECVAEGVETVQHLDVLRQNGCNIAQGFLYDRPLPVEEYEKRLDMRWYQVW